MSSLIKTSLSKRHWIIIKILLLLSVFVFIYIKLGQQDDISHDLVRYIRNAFDNHWSYLLVIILLMPFNWGLEALKWQLLTKVLSPISFGAALKGVLTGLSLSFISPHGVGDYFGRIMQMKNSQRGRFVGSIMIGRGFQMLPTLIFGLYGVFYLVKDNKVIYTYALGILALLGIIYLIYYILKKQNVRLNRYIRYYLGIIGEYSVIRLISILTISFLRYGVFALQFVLMIHAFLPDIAVGLSIAGVTWVFLTKSVMPSFNFLSDLGVREFTAVYFFDQYHVDLTAIVCASLAIWIVNILLPTIVGAPFTLKMRLKS